MEYFLLVIDWLDRFTIVVATVTVFFTGRTWWNQKKYSQKQLEDVVIQLRCGEKTKKLGLTIKRKYFSRSELQGTLANCYEGKQYDLPYLKEDTFARDILQVQEGMNNQLEIWVDDEVEFGKFYGKMGEGERVEGE